MECSCGVLVSPTLRHCPSCAREVNWRGRDLRVSDQPRPKLGGTVRVPDVSEHEDKLETAKDVYGKPEPDGGGAEERIRKPRRSKSRGRYYCHTKRGEYHYGFDSIPEAKAAAGRGGRVIDSETGMWVG